MIDRTLQRKLKIEQSEPPSQDNLSTDWFGLSQNKVSEWSNMSISVSVDSCFIETIEIAQ